ncbi:acetyltransferase, GNAT family [Arthrobacter sp. Hiyo4]|nr:acetyltransferase, GNAT family [Arthrobacter sp. Hiyo4]
MGAMGTVDDSLADLPEPDRGCLQHVIDMLMQRQI